MDITAERKVGKNLVKFKTLNTTGTFQGMDAAIHGMRQPLQSFGKSDSFWSDGIFVIGENDMKLAKGLRQAGPEHCKYLRMIPVWVDITAPESYWAEWDTYKVGTTANSTSTMHTLYKDKLENAFDFSYGIDEEADSAFKQYLKAIKNCQEKLNDMQKGTEEYNDYHNMLSKMLPRAFKYTRTVNLNYSTLANMYHQRKDHRKKDWSVDFVNWVHTLPYSELITLEK